MNSHYAKTPDLLKPPKVHFNETMLWILNILKHFTNVPYLFPVILTRG